MFFFLLFTFLVRNLCSQPNECSVTHAAAYRSQLMTYPNQWIRLILQTLNPRHLFVRIQASVSYCLVLTDCFFCHGCANYLLTHYPQLQDDSCSKPFSFDLNLNYDFIIYIYRLPCRPGLSGWISVPYALGPVGMEMI